MEKTSVQNLVRHYSVEASPFGVRAALKELAVELTALGVVEDDVQRTELVLAEALNNIVEHALIESKDAKVGLGLKLSQSHAEFEVVDTGLPMPGEALPEGCLPASDVTCDELPEGGFGWFMIHTLTDKLRYERADGRNLLTFSVALTAATVSC